MIYIVILKSGAKFKIGEPQLIAIKDALLQLADQEGSLSDHTVFIESIVLCLGDISSIVPEGWML